MIIINLLSPNHKRELKTKRIYIAIKELVMLVLLFTAIIATMLLTSKYILDNKLAKLITRNAHTIEENRTVVSKISILNSKIKIANNIQNNFNKWSSFMATIATATPNNISYDVIRIRYEDASIELKGVAKTRDDLTDLRDSLENLTIINNVNLPLQSLLPKDNNQFIIGANIVTNELK
jgi:Tfp pilus assembly protein PilN